MERRRESRAARRKRVMRNRAIALGALIVIIVVIIIIIASCSKKETGSNSGDGANPVEAVTNKDGEEITEEAADAEAEDADAGKEDAGSSAKVKNEKPVTLYTMDYNTMTCKKATDIRKAWTDTEDLDSFGAFCSTEDSFPFTSETLAHQETWDSIKTDTDYKIGYELSFDKDGKAETITILEPGDIESNEDLYNGDYPEDGDYSAITGVLGVWVYDDMHQEEGAFYTHITQSEVNDNTLLTSIKLRPTPQSDQIDNLVLKAFSYSSDEEFDADGHYTGSSASQIKIEKE